MAGWRTYATLLMATVAAGCGGDSASEKALDDLRAALERYQSTSYRGQFDMKVDTKEDGRFALAGTMLADETSGRGRFDGTLTAGLRKVPMDFLIDGNALWYRSPAFAADLPPGKRWIQASADGGLGPTLTPRQLAELVEAAGDAEDLGEEKVGGEVLDHLRATIDLAELADDARGGFAASLRRLDEDSEAPLRFDLWNGPDGRPRKFAVSLEVPAAAEGRPQLVRAQATIDEYDVSVPEARPPAGTVITEAEAGI